MKQPIPDDFTGEWACYQVTWPKSVKWTAVLLGLLSSPMLGRFWDERTGSVKSVQSIGMDIWERSGDLLPCVEDTPVVPNDGGGDSSSCRTVAPGLEDCEETMPAVSWLAIEDGILYMYFGPCCKVAVGSAADFEAGVDDLGDTPLNPHDETPDPNTYSACAKAWAVIDAIELVLNKAYDLAFSSLAFWMLPGKLETEVDMNLNDKWSSILLIDWHGLGVLITAENAFTDEDQQKSAAALVNVFSDDSLGVPDEATYEAVKNAIHTRGLVYDGLIMTAIAVLGRKNLDNIVKLAAGNIETRSCGEPTVDPELLFGDLIWQNDVSSLTRSNGTFTPVGRSNNGLTYTWDFVAESGWFKALIYTHTFERKLGTSFTELTIALEPITPTDELLHWDWEEGGCPNVGEDGNVFGKIDPDVGTVVHKWDGNYFYIRWTYATPQTWLQFSSGEARVCPSNADNTGKHYRWAGHIVSINNVDTGVIPNTTW